MYLSTLAKKYCLGKRVQHLSTKKFQIEIYHKGKFANV